MNLQGGGGDEYWNPRSLVKFKVHKKTRFKLKHYSHNKLQPKPFKINLLLV